MDSDNKTTVRTNNEESKESTTNIEVKQGCVSPLLLWIVVEKGLKETEQKI